MRTDYVINDDNLLKLMTDLSKNNGPVSLNSTEMLSFKFIHEKDGHRWYVVNLTRRQMRVLDRVVNGIALRKNVEKEYDLR